MNLYIKPTSTTPGVAFDETVGTLEFSGQSYPEDSVPFYQEIQNRVEHYLEETHKPLTVIFRLDYFNTSSSKCLLNLLEAVEHYHTLFNNILIQWYYEADDEDMHNNGIDFGLDVKVPFEFIPIAT